MLHKYKRNNVIILLGLLIISVVINFFIFWQTTPGEEKEYNEEFLKQYGVYAVKIPEKLDFAGEPVPLSNFDVRESLDRELLINTYWQSQTMLLFKRANRFFPIIESILKNNNIPDDFKYLALAESGFSNVVSPSGARGFWQFIDNTAKLYGLEISDEVDERYNLEKSTIAACKYLREAYTLYNSWTLAAASYNLGKGGINKQIKRQKLMNYYDLLLTEETARYVFRILALKVIFNNPEEYGYHIKRNHLYKPFETYEVKIDTAIPNLADFAFKYTINYKILKMFNPWLRSDCLTNKQRKEYIIKIPVFNKEDRRIIIPGDTIFIEENEERQ